MTLKQIRADALQQRIENTADYEFNHDEIYSNVKNAYNRLEDLIRRLPNKEYFVDIHVGNLKTSEKELTAIVKTYNEQIYYAGYSNEIIAQKSTFSWFGDPYFMGEEEDRVRYYVRITENKALK